MWLLPALLLLLIFTSNVASAPIPSNSTDTEFYGVDPLVNDVPLIHRWKRNGDGLDVAVRIDNNLPQGSNELEEQTKECYFKHHRSTTYETSPRPKTSEVGVNCHGPLRRMSELVEMEVKELFQAPNPLALVLQRGGGEFEIDWEDSIETVAIGQRYICKKHLDSLLLDWGSVTRPHIKRKLLKNRDRVKACSMPHPPFFNHDELLPLDKKKDYRIESDEAHSILVLKGILIHPGLREICDAELRKFQVIAVCERHNKAAQKILAEFVVKKTGHKIRPRVFRQGLFDTPDIIDDVIPFTQNRDIGDSDYFPPMHQERSERYRDPRYSDYEKFMKSLGLSTSLGDKPWYELVDRSKRRKAQTLLDVTNQIATFMSPDDPQSLMKAAFRAEFDIDYERPRSQQYEQMMVNVRESFELADSRAAKLAALSLVAHLSLTEIHRYIPSLSSYYHTEARRFARRGFHLEDKTIIHVKYDAAKVDRFIHFLTSWKVTIGLPFGYRTVKDGSGQFTEIPNTLRLLRVGEIIHLYRKELRDENDEHLLLPESTAKKIVNICSAVRRRVLFSRVCERCEQLQLFFGDFRATLEEIQKNPTTVDLASQIEIIRRDWYQHEEQIVKLKSHQLRTAKSEEDRRIIVDTLEEGDCLLTKDFAMKLLPIYSRETTSDFFGQRGTGWHVTHCLTVRDGEYKQHNLIHILSGDRQDSPVVTAILRHSLATLKEHGIKRVVLRSDQAGAYKSSATIATIPSIAKEVGIEIRGYHYSEAQAGKGACDRTSAVVKRKVRDAADSNKNVINAKDFFDAATTGRLYDGISYHLIRVESKKGGEARISNTKIGELSKLNSFTFEPQAVRAHRYKGIGTGRIISTKNFVPNNAVVRVIEEGGMLNVSQFWAKVGSQKVTEEKEDEDAEVCQFDPSTNSDKCEKIRLNTLFRCPIDSCGQEFLSSSNLERHLLLGKHRAAPERVHFRDYSLNQFSRFIELVAPQRVCKVVDESIATSVDDSSNGKVQEMGWALPQKRKSTRHSPRAKAYIKSLYDIGESTKVKVDARSAAKKMRDERKGDGSMYFQPEELLNSKQIASLFSLFKRQKLDENEKVPKRKKTSKEDIDDNADEEDELSTEGDPEEGWDTDPLFDDEDDMRASVREKKDDVFTPATTRTRSRASAEGTSKEQGQSKRRSNDRSKSGEQKPKKKRFEDEFF